MPRPHKPKVARPVTITGPSRWEREKARRHANGVKPRRVTIKALLAARRREEASEARHEALHESVYLPRILAARAAKIETCRVWGVLGEGEEDERPYEPRVYRQPRFESG